ncbi:MAG: 4'-phosphopantetheinyl transferase superfamily protein [Candidatus Paceibacterota bacterium]
MILGVGIDIIDFEDFSRIYKFLKKRKALKYLFFKEELKFEKDIKRLASILALKEATYKTISPFLRKEILFNQIKILKRDSSKTEIIVEKNFFLPAYQKQFLKKKMHFFLSLSYSKKSVIALVVAELRD